MKLDLVKEIQAHGEPVKELEFREPLGKDIKALGIPFKVAAQADGGVDTSFNSEVIAAYIARLANIPPSSVDQLSAPDYVNAMGVVVGFFGATTP